MGSQNRNNRKKAWDFFRRSLGFHSNPTYIEEKLKEADVQSSIYLSFFVMCIEAWLLVRYMFKYVFPGKCETFGIYLKYTHWYWILLIASILLFIYGILYVRGKLRYLRSYSRAFIFCYFVLGLCFGIITSITDFSKGKMITCFLAMTLFVTFIFVVRPYISILIMTVAGMGFVMLINHYAVDKEGLPMRLDTGDTINYVTFFLTLTVLYLTVYYQRYADAQKAYKLEKAAITDALTESPNMVNLEAQCTARIEEMLGKGQTPIYLLFDIKNFQTYNDRYGYKSGDVLLRKMAKVLQDAFPGDLYARHYADKFLVLTDATDCESKVSKVESELRGSRTSETYLGIAVGAYRPRQATVSPRHAMDRAQYAMHKMKNGSSVRIAEYNAEIRKEYRLRQHIFNHLKDAINEGYIVAYYQPVIDAKDGTLCGCEALARWIDPKLGFLSPGQFIPILEESRQIHKLDRCIYEYVFRNMRQAMDRKQPVFPVSLNFSRLDFELMDVVATLEELTTQYNIPKDYIHVEVTESALTKDEEGLQTAINRLHEKGYVVWLDDFGSGYSSMNVLKDFHFDLLKIDMVFLKGFSDNSNSRRIIKSILDLAESLGMETLTEGVETEEAVQFLQEAGCGKLQGYYYGKPQTYGEILDKLGDGTYRISPMYEGREMR